MKSFKIFGTVLFTLAAIGLFGCGGSSYLSEFPPADETSSTAIFRAGGTTDPYSMSMSVKDITLTHITGDADGNGDSFLDAGLHYCFFEFDSATLPAGHIQIKSSAAECSGIVDCGYCEATQLDYPDCEISCTINTSAHSGLVGEYLEIRYVDKLLMYSDAAGSSGGALRIEGEALDSIGGNNLFDSTTRAFTIVDGGLVLDQVTPLTNVLEIQKFDYTLQITDMILDPLASSHNLALPDNTAWVDIESRVAAQLPLTDLAVPSTTVDLDAGHYASNAGFWHDLVNEHDVLAFLIMFNELMEFQDAGVLDYENCGIAWTQECAGVGTQCVPYYTERAGACELLCMDTSATSPIMANQALDQTACQNVGGDLGDVWDIGLPSICLPNQLGVCMSEFPLGGGTGFYVLDTSDLYMVYTDTLSGAEKSTAEYLDYIFETMADVDASNLWDPVEGVNTLRDLHNDCAAQGLKVLLQTQQHLGQLDPAFVDGDDCYDVAERFLDGPSLAPESRSLRDQMSLDFITKHGVDYIRIFYNDPWVSISPRQRQIFENQTLGISDALLSSTVPGGQIGVSLDSVPMVDRHLYSSLASGAAPAQDPEVHIYGNLTLSWVDPLQTHTARGNGTPNHFTVFVQLEEDSGTNRCDDGISGNFGFYLDVIGSCASLSDTYRRGVDDYNIAVSPSLANEETGEANLNSIFLTSAAVDALAGASDPDTPAEWEIGVSKTMRELAADCSTRGGLAAIPYSMNSEDVVNPDNPVCWSVLNRFLTDATEGHVNTLNNILLPHPLKIDITEVDLGVPYGIEQYIDVEVFDRDSSTYQRLFNVFEDVEDGLPDTILHPDADPIPRGWFVAEPDDRATAQHHLAKVPPDGNPGGVDGQPLNIYTTFYEDPPSSGLWYPVWELIDFQPITAPGTDWRNVRKVGASFDIHRAEKDWMMHSNTPFEYFIYISLSEPVDPTGALVEPGHSEFCSYDGNDVLSLQYLVDGRCVDDILPTP